MARPIETTPVLTGRSAARFDRLMKNCKYRPTPKRRINWKEIDRILAEEASRLDNAGKGEGKILHGDTK